MYRQCFGASKNSLTVFALLSDRRPTEKTKLHYAPFFNIYEDGKVCMGTVSIDIKIRFGRRIYTGLGTLFFQFLFQPFVGQTQSHKRHCVNLWKDLVNTDKTFPKKY
jgi:hypothetical protein